MPTHTPIDVRPQDAYQRSEIEHVIPDPVILGAISTLQLREDGSHPEVGIVDRNYVIG